MPLSASELDKLAQLAYLDTKEQSTNSLNDELNSIMNFVEQLRAANTQDVSPLFHPLAMHQRYREDEITEENCIAQLEEIAPLFEDDLYWVPKVIEGDA